MNIQRVSEIYSNLRTVVFVFFAMLAKQIADTTGYPLYHLDVEFWRPGWIMTPREEKIERQRKMVSGDKWFYPYFDDMAERWDAGTGI